MKSTKLIFTVIILFTLLFNNKSVAQMENKITSVQEFYNGLNKIKLDKKMVVNGSAAEVLTQFFQSPLMRESKVNFIKFNFSLEFLSPTSPKVNLGIVEKAPATVVLQQILEQTRWHIDSFHNGILTINCWSMPSSSE